MLKQLFVVLDRRIYKGTKHWAGASERSGFSFPCSDEAKTAWAQQGGNGALQPLYLFKQAGDWSVPKASEAEVEFMEVFRV